jgi:hypothetical protein
MMTMVVTEQNKLFEYDNTPIDSLYNYIQTNILDDNANCGIDDVASLVFTLDGIVSMRDKCIYFNSLCDANRKIKNLKIKFILTNYNKLII